MEHLKKLAAFLHRPPDFALFSDGADSRGRRLFEALVPASAEIDWNSIEEAAGVARGLDLPPFVRDLDAGHFQTDPRITHPLSSESLELDIPSGLTAEASEGRLHDVLKGLWVDSGEDPERFFAAVWRLLPDRLAADDPTGLGAVWKVLPADPCLPSHTIWEQASVASAVAGAWPDPAILIFTLASAQDFVTTARRTQDAWMGSYLLSYLCWEAIREVADFCGPDAVITPSLRGQPLADLWLRDRKGLKDLVPEPDQSILAVGNMPNIFTAIVPAADGERIARAAEASVRKAWSDICRRVREGVEESALAAGLRELTSWRDIWERQTSDFIDSLGLYWAVCPWGRNPDRVLDAVRTEAHSEPMTWFEQFLKNLEAEGWSVNIGMLYHNLSSLAAQGLSARKNLRDFRPLDELGHKCSLCGRGEALHPHSGDGKTADYADIREFWGKTIQYRAAGQPVEVERAHPQGGIPVCGLPDQTPGPGRFF